MRAKLQKFGNLRLLGRTAPTFLPEIFAEGFRPYFGCKFAVEARVLRFIKRIAASQISVGHLVR